MKSCGFHGIRRAAPEIRWFCHQIDSSLRVLEKNTPWANRAELYIGLIKEAVRQDMKASNCPIVFWDYCAERRARIQNLTVSKMIQNSGHNPNLETLGDADHHCNVANMQGGLCRG